MRTHHSRIAIAFLLSATALIVPASSSFAAEGDHDNDGVENSVDNCPYKANPKQENRHLTDGDPSNDDAEGDHCDDSDADGLNDHYEINVSRTDPDDPDTDGDGWRDGYEVGKSNPRKADTDGDGIDDPADPCPRYAGEPNSAGECAPEPEQPEEPDPVGDALGTILGPVEDVIGDVATPDGGFVDELQEWSSDGYVLQIEQQADDRFAIKVLDAATERPVNLALEPYKYFRDGKVHAELYEADGTPTEGTPIPTAQLEYRYVDFLQTVYVQVFLPETVEDTAITFTLPVAGLPADTSEKTGFYNSEKSDDPRDEYDAVPELTDVG